LRWGLRILPFQFLPKDIFLYLAPFKERFGTVLFPKVDSVKHAFGGMINLGHAVNPSFWILPDYYGDAFLFELIREGYLKVIIEIR
jgi:hypothetical protein